MLRDDLHQVGPLADFLDDGVGDGQYERGLGQPNSTTVTPVPPSKRSPGAEGGMRGSGPEELLHLGAEGPGSLAVDDAEGGEAGHERGVEGAAEAQLQLVHAQAAQVHLGARLHVGGAT